MTVVLKCPDCGRFSANCTIQQISTQNGWNEYYAGTCNVHGEWSDSAA